MGEPVPKIHSAAELLSEETVGLTGCTSHSRTGVQALGVDSPVALPIGNGHKVGTEGSVDLCGREQRSENEDA